MGNITSENVLRILIELEKKGLARKIGSKDPRKCKWGKTRFGWKVLKELERQEKMKSLRKLE